jgi:signal transduction histidine kinase
MEWATDLRLFRMKSIRSKLLLTFISLICSLVVIGLIINHFFLEPYYIHQKTLILKNSSQEFKSLYTNKRKNGLVSYVDTLEKSHDLSIEVLSIDGVTRYSSLNADNKEKIISLFNQPSHLLKPDVSTSRIELFRRKLTKEQFYVTETTLKSFDLEFLLVASKLDNQNLLIIRTPKLAIRESVGIYNYFLIYIGLALLVVGTMFALVMARSFAKPILQLNTMANDMTKQSFSKKWRSKRKDELGQLGHSMNDLSGILSRFIKELNVKNETLTNQLEEKVQFEKKRRLFISNVSHELKTPITIIQSYTEGLQVGVNNTEEEKQEYLEIIMDEANKMEKMVYDLLNLSKIQNSKVDLLIEHVDFIQLLNEIIKLYTPQFVEHQITFEFEKSSNELRIKTDRAKVQQILNNYLNNALYHVNEHKMIKMKVIEKEKSLFVSVYNSGKQIPENEMEVIWESFYRADSARNREKGNVGLGLSIVKELSILLNGNIGVKNEENGVVFWLELPIA